MRIAVTGGPCSGKSSLLSILKIELPALAQVPEVATMLLSGGFPVEFANESSRHAFQYAVYQSQYSAERSMHAMGKPYIVDRTLADGAGYFPAF